MLLTQEDASSVNSSMVKGGQQPSKTTAKKVKKATDYLLLSLAKSSNQSSAQKGVATPS